MVRFQQSAGKFGYYLLVSCARLPQVHVCLQYTVGLHSKPYINYPSLLVTAQSAEDLIWWWLFRSGCSLPLALPLPLALALEALGLLHYVAALIWGPIGFSTSLVWKVISTFTPLTVIVGFSQETSACWQQSSYLWPLRVDNFDLVLNWIRVG